MCHKIASVIRLVACKLKRQSSEATKVVMLTYTCFIDLSSLFFPGSSTIPSSTDHCGE